jgi:hypothetical protein
MAVMVRFAPVGWSAGGSSTEAFAVVFVPDGEVLVVQPAVTTVAAKMLASNTHKILLSVLIYDARRLVIESCKF